MVASRRAGTLAAAGALLATAIAIGPPAAGQGGEIGGEGHQYYLNDSWTAQANRSFFYGRPDDRVLVGDWDGDGADTLAVRRGNLYHFRDALSGGPADRVIAYGRTDDTVLMGDWDGDGDDTPAVRRGNVYHVKNSLAGGQADLVLAFGRPDDAVVVGDWDGDGADTLGVRRGNVYHLANSLAGGDADVVLAYGRPDDQVYTGDWDGDEDDSFAVRRGNVYYVTDGLVGGSADRVVPFGRVSDTTLVGDWNADGRDTLGVRRALPLTERQVAERALAAAAALDRPELLRWATPPTADWMIYAFGDFYELEGPFSVGTCEPRHPAAATCLVMSADFGDTAIGAMLLTEMPQGSWTVVDYEIFSD